MDNRKLIDPFSLKIKSCRYERIMKQKSSLAGKKYISHLANSKGYCEANTMYVEISPGVFGKVSTKTSYVKRIPKGSKSSYLKKVCNKKVRKYEGILSGKNNDYRKVYDYAYNFI